MSTTFSNIPPEMFAQISVYLEPPDLNTVLLLSRQSHAVVVPILWREIDLGRISKGLNLPNHKRSTRSQNASSALTNLIHTKRLVWDLKEVDANPSDIRRAIKLFNHEVATLRKILPSARNLRAMQLGIHSWTMLGVTDKPTLALARKADQTMLSMIRLLRQTGSFNIALSFGNLISRPAQHYMNTIVFEFPERIISLAMPSNAVDVKNYIAECQNLENLEFRNSSSKDLSSLLIQNKSLKSITCDNCWVQPVSWLKRLSVNSSEGLSSTQWGQIFELSELEYLDVSIDGRNRLYAAPSVVHSPSAMRKLKHFFFTYQSNEHDPPHGLFKTIALAGSTIQSLKIYSRISDEDFQVFVDECPCLSTVYFRPQHAEKFTTHGMLSLSRAKRLRVLQLDYSCPPLTFDVVKNIVLGCPSLMEVSVHMFSLNFKAIRTEGWDQHIRPSVDSPLFHHIQVQTLRRELLNGGYVEKFVSDTKVGV
ncbi:hypothetical protein NEOLI_003858 [Neolecta irregularis DAH-3]|uniref:F-box domain-containing protein n=1 Tax=Neolecta irregularis (strain DAH-3) TaxID=1198029 RepID=A0A1U7LQR5_NEOID|nr:hypothetical protein NEOLI_003858 [Neolecta irregularis DAH-3]|eukprot:OLL24923.1 hypothetical protein NEOLI_003858 [Neolecta irregularis DAH-3]